MSDWPNLFIAGAPRCGTSSLHSWLQAIPGIYMSRIKEPNFFSRAVIADDHPLVKPIRDESEYLALFSGAGTATILGEASPNYLEDPEAPFHIARKSPRAKVLVSLRDPVERLYSHYLMLRNNRPALGSFVEEIERGLAQQDNPRLAVLVPSTGLYTEHVSRYRQVFGESRFKVLIFEELMADVPGAIREILTFLGIEHEIGDFTEPAQRQYSEVRGPLVRFLFGNRSISRFVEASVPYRLRKFVRNALLVKQAPKPRMDPKAREVLVRYYRDDVRRLEVLLGRRLPWRNFAEIPKSQCAT
jgi:Sulfotransferase domain